MRRFFLIAAFVIPFSLSMLWVQRQDRLRATDSPLVVRQFAVLVRSPREDHPVLSSSESPCAGFRRQVLKLDFKRPVALPVGGACADEDYRTTCEKQAGGDCVVAAVVLRAKWLAKSPVPISTEDARDLVDPFVLAASRRDSAELRKISERMLELDPRIFVAAKAVFLTELAVPEISWERLVAFLRRAIDLNPFDESLQALIPAVQGKQIETLRQASKAWGLKDFL